MTSSKCSWPEEMNDCESYSLGLVFTHHSESDGEAEVDWGERKWALDRAGLDNEEELVCTEQ